MDVSLGRGAAGGRDDLRPDRATPPVDRRGQVRRSQLLARLDAVSDRVPVIVLAAPAGYGKTTALRQWAATGRRRVGWASINRRRANWTGAGQVRACWAGAVPAGAARYQLVRCRISWVRGGSA